MARIRTIKPDFWSDETVVELQLATRLLFIGLWSFCDDQGYIDYRPRQIKMRVFPVDDVDVEGCLHELHRRGMVACFDTADGPVLQVCGWSRHQRISNAAAPRYDHGDLRPLSSLPQILARAREGSGVLRNPPGEGRKERKGMEGKEIEPTVLSTSENAANGTSTCQASRPDVDELCEHLADRIEANGSKRPKVGAKWRTSARLMLDRDGRTLAQAHAAIDWCQDEDFWRTVILSMPTLRSKYDQLRLSAQRTTHNHPDHPKKSTTDERFAQGMALSAKFADDDPCQSGLIELGSLA